MKIKAEQDEEKLTPAQEAAEREQIEQRIKELVLEAVSLGTVHVTIQSADIILIQEADKSDPVMKIE